MNLSSEQLAADFQATELKNEASQLQDDQLPSLPALEPAETVRLTLLALAKTNPSVLDLELALGQIQQLQSWVKGTEVHIR